MSDLYRYYDPDSRRVVRKDSSALGGTVGDDNATILHFEYPRGFMDSRIAYIVFDVKDDNGNYIYYSPDTTPAFDGYTFAIPSNVMSRVTRNNLRYGLGFVYGAGFNNGNTPPDTLAVENSAVQNLAISTFPPRPSEIVVDPDLPIPTDSVASYPDPIGIPNPTDHAWLEYLKHNAVMDVTFDENTGTFVFVTFEDKRIAVSITGMVSLSDLVWSDGVSLRQKLVSMDETDAALRVKLDQEIADRTDDVNEEEAARISADTNLSALITTNNTQSLARDDALGTRIDDHVNDLDNPHEVTKAQVGLGNADNTSDMNKPVSTAQQEAIDEAVSDEATLRENGDAALRAQINTANADVLAHLSAYDNPHAVTKAQVGLEHADNTSDADKPISDATQAALNDKQDALTFDETPTAGSSNPVKSKGILGALGNKVDKVAGKQLSTNDYTDADKTKLAGIEVGAQVNTVTSVAGRTGAITLDSGDVGLPNVDNTSDANKPLSTPQKEYIDDKVADEETARQTQVTATQTYAEGVNDALSEHNNNKANPHAVTKAQVGLPNVDNTSDMSKPVSTAQQTALNGKVDKVAGKQLSTNDFTNNDKSKLDGIQTGAQANVNADWAATSGDAKILNKPVLGTASTYNAGLGPGQLPILNEAGKLPDSTIPPLAIGEYLGSVPTQAQLVTLDGQKGDIAKVTADPLGANNGAYWLAGDPTDLNSWIQMSGAGIVFSVNGQTGAVILSASDLGALADNFGAENVGKYLRVNADGSITCDSVSSGNLVGNTPGKDLGVSSAGTATTAARSDHVHNMPTKGDIGLGNVDNTSDADKPVSTAQQTAINSAVATEATARQTADNALDDKIDNVTSNMTSHIADKSNPHEVTKAQVGLSNADNTSDADKPVSTAQQTAINSAVATEATARQVADITLQSNITTEAGVRFGTDNMLNDMISTETSARKSADSLLQDAIDTEAASRASDLSGKVSKTGDTMTGSLTINAGTANSLTDPALTASAPVIIGGDTQTSYTGVFNARKCSGDGNNANSLGIFVDADGSAKLVHRRGAMASASDDASLRLDGTGLSFAYGKAKGGTPISYEVMHTGNVEAVSPIQISSATVGNSVKISLTHSDSGVTASTMGSAVKMPVISVDSKGHVTALTDTTIYPPTTAGSSNQIWASKGTGVGQWVTPESTVSNSPNVVSAAAVQTALSVKANAATVANKYDKSGGDITGAVRVTGSNDIVLVGGNVKFGETGDGGLVHNTTPMAVMSLAGTDASQGMAWSSVSDISAQMGISTHINNKNNPHAVTKAQIGLPNVDNTSDMNKPVSIFTQAALDDKEDKWLKFSDVKVSDWVTNTDTEVSGYDYMCTIALNNVVEDMIPRVFLSVADATSGLYSSIAKSNEGGVTIYSRTNVEITIPMIVVQSGSIPVLPHYKTYVLNFDMSAYPADPTGCFSYGGDCEGFTPVLNSNTTVLGSADMGSWAFDENGYGPFGMFYATLNQDKTISSVLNPNNLALNIDGTPSEITTKNTMLCIPTLYIKNSSLGLSLSTDPSKGTPYAHTIDGVVHKYLGISVYNGFNNGGVLMSLSGALPTKGQNIATFRTQVQANGEGWMLWNYYHWMLMRELGVFFPAKSFDGQGKIGRGGRPIGTNTTGVTDAYGPWCGGIVGNNVPVKALIEDWWGSERLYIDDFFGVGGVFFAGQKSVPSDDASGKVQVFSGLTGGWWYGQTIYTDDTNFGMASGSGGSATTGLCDGQYGGTGNRVGTVGSWSSDVGGGNAGPSHMNANFTTSNILNDYVGTRISCVFD